jgi:hypothetical protein
VARELELEQVRLDQPSGGEHLESVRGIYELDLEL